VLVLTTKHLRQESRGVPPRCLGRVAVVAEGRVRVEPLRRVGPRMRGAAVGVELARVRVRVRIRVRVRARGSMSGAESRHLPLRAVSTQLRHAGVERGGRREGVSVAWLGSG